MHSGDRNSAAHDSLRFHLYFDVQGVVRVGKAENGDTLGQVYF